MVHLNATGLHNFNYYEVVCFLHNFHKTEETLLGFSNLEIITAHRMRHRARIGAPRVAVDGKVLRISQFLKKYFRQLMMCKLRRANCMVSC
jgi:hypothetical protein